MSRKNPLVLDGNEVRFRLEAERVHSKTPVHIDWVRFTVIRRNCAAPSVDDLFPLAKGDAVVWDGLQELDRVLRQLPDCDHSAAAQAMELALEVAGALGRDFVVHPEARKGLDFYRFRLSIERNGAEVGWVGFQASSDSPRQATQGKTLHVNIEGAACTFAEVGWNHRIADIVDARSGTLTRGDLALDFFDGLQGGISRVVADYEAGLLDVCGKRLKANNLGDWTSSSKGARSFYVGSKEAGKQTNAYEKGDQLFGVEAGSRWLRVELRYGNKLRELSTEMLRRPADFFAGASDWHAAILREADAQQVQPEPVARKSRLPIETVKAEATRVLRWLKRTAGPVVGLALRELPESVLLEFMSNPQKPGRLSRFSAAEISAAISQVLTVERAGLAFA
jgi:phage replication initiation protein